MCFHNSMNKKVKDLAARYGRRSDAIEIVKEIVEEQYHVSAFNNPEYPIITVNPEIQLFRWGLIPFWTKDLRTAETIRSKTYNARSESVFDKPSFRNAVKTKRCLIPSTGWFDWRHENGKKVPYFIYVKGQEIFSMAGIYDDWKNPESGETEYTFSMLTTDANRLMHYIHNTNFRMPVLLAKEEEEQWLDPELTEEEIGRFMRPYSDDDMSAYTVRNDFLKKNPHDESIIQATSVPLQ